MSKAELTKMIVAETKGLSPEVQVKVLDFIQFLKAKQHTRNEKKSFETMVRRELTELDNVSLNHLEEEFANYKK